MINIPPDFDRAVDRGENPGVLIDADATDPTAIGNAVAALGLGRSTALNRDLPPIRQAQPQAPPFQFVVHARYNPEQLTVLNIVPGLIVHRADVLDAVRHDARRSPASASAARWRICWRCRCGRSR